MTPGGPAPVPDEVSALITHDTFEAVNDSTDAMYSAEVNWSFNDMKLTSITSYQDYDLDTTVDGDFVEFAFLAQQNFPFSGMIGRPHGAFLFHAFDN